MEQGGIYRIRDNDALILRRQTQGNTLLLVLRGNSHDPPHIIAERSQLRHIKGIFLYFTFPCRHEKRQLIVFGVIISEAPRAPEMAIDHVRLVWQFGQHLVNPSLSDAMRQRVSEQLKIRERQHIGAIYSDRTPIHSEFLLFPADRPIMQHTEWSDHHAIVPLSGELVHHLLHERI